MRKKWEEAVSYTATQINDCDTERNKLIVRNGGNGDLYLTICPESHRGSRSMMRFERSGGTSTKNPRLMRALTEVYDAIAGNEQVVYPKDPGEEVCVWRSSDTHEAWSSDCGVSFAFKEAFYPEERGFNFCQKCGKKIEVMEEEF